MKLKRAKRFETVPVSEALRKAVEVDGKKKNATKEIVKKEPYAVRCIDLPQQRCDL